MSKNYDFHTENQETSYCYKRKSSDIKHKNTKNPEINFTFLPLFHCFPITQTQIEHKPNINLILKREKKKETENSQRVLNYRRVRTLSMRMDHVVKFDEKERETDSRLKRKTEKEII